MPVDAKGLFQCGYPRKAFDKVNWYVWNRLYLHFNRKSQRGYVLKYAPNFYLELQAMGLHNKQWGYIGFNGGGSDTSRVPHGEPYAGKLHVRFDEGAGVPHGASRSTLQPTSRTSTLPMPPTHNNCRSSNGLVGCAARSSPRTD